MARQEFVENVQWFWQQIERDKMIHVITDGGPNPNPGSAGWGAVITQSGRFTTIWHHFDHASNTTMELRAAAEALRFIPAGMTAG
jgi:ribonuclease HI